MGESTLTHTIVFPRYLRLSTVYSPELLDRVDAGKFWEAAIEHRIDLYHIHLLICNGV